LPQPNAFAAAPSVADEAARRLATALAGLKEGGEE